jgi:asparagine synthase (glutamine-hydrolysing)
MQATTLTRGARDGAKAIAGAFGSPAAADPARELARLEAAVAPDGPRVALRRSGALTVAAAGDGSHPLELVDGCVCAIEGSLYALDQIARELGLPAGAGAAQVVVAAYRRLGTAALGRLRGDFALLVWDEAASRGLLARDQLGGGALFLRVNGRELLFASELRNLLRLLPSRPAPDPVAMVHWLALGGPPADHTFYQGIEQLPAGHCVELDGSGWRMARYWRPEYERPERIDRKEAAERVHDGLVRAVLRRCGEGDVAGVMLSGGIDSAAVAGVMASRGRPPVRAYSAVFPRHPAIDESGLIELLTSELELSSFALPVLGGSVISGAVDYMREWQVPATSPNLFFWETLLRQAARDGVTAMLDGEGGDALFWFSPYLLSDRLARGRLRSAASLAGRFPSDAGRVPPSIVARLIRDWGIKGAVPYPLHRLRQRIRGRDAFAPRWFTQESIRLRFDTDPALDWKRSGAPRWWSSLLDGVTGIGSTLVHDTTRRRNASVGLHARHPLLDVDLIELVLALPPELAFDARLSRPLLRESVRGLIPEELRLRPTKSSFDALFHELLSGPDLAAARSLVLAPDAEVNAFVDPIRVRAELFDAGPPRTAGALQSWALDVWRLVTAETWLRSQAGRSLGALDEG